MKAEIFNYNGNNITFQKENSDVMIRLTDFAKQFPTKNLSKIVKSKEIQEYINEYATITNVIPTDLLIVNNGGSNFGTWAHQKVALRIAQKLSPKFAIWVDSKIEELLTTGQTQFNASDEDQAILQAMNILNQRVSLQKEQLQIQAPKVKYVDEVLQSRNTYTATQIAKDLDMKSATEFNQTLSKMGIHFKTSKNWVLYAKYQNKGYTKTKTYNYTDSNGNVGSSMQTVWTERGRLFVNKLLKKELV